MTRLPVVDRPRFRVALVAVVAALLGYSSAANAQTTYTWTGGATPNGSWATAGNWDANGVPVDDLINTNVVLTTSINLLTTVDLAPGGLFNLNSLVINASAGGFTVNPTGTNVTTLRLGGGGLSVASNATQNIVVPLALGANQTWANTGTGVTNVRGAVAATGQTLTIGGTGAIAVTGAITGGTVTQSGTGATTLAGNNTLTALNVNAGTVIVNQATAGSNPLGSGPVTLGGGTLSFRAFGNPLAVSGFNHDAITSVSDFASGAATGYGTSRAIDGADGGGAFVYYERGANTAQPTQGVPVGGQFTGTTAATSNNTYQLGDYGSGGARSNNVLSLGAPGGANASGTLALTAPGQYRTLSIMNVTGSGSSVYSFTLNFADGTSTTVGGNASPDWFGGPDAITLVVLGGRMNRGSGAFENNGNNPRIYGTEYTLSAADALKTLNSVTFAATTNAGGTLNIFGMSGLSGASTQTYANALGVTANSTVDQVNVPNIVVGPLAINGSTLSFTNNGTSTFTAGAVTLSGNPTFNTAAGTTFLAGALGDGGAARTLTKSGGGAMTLTAAATSFGAGSAVNVTGGSLNANATDVIGTQAAVNVSSGATLGVGANQTVASLTGANGSTVALGGNTLTVNGGTATTFAGRITGSAGSSLVVGGAGTVLNLTGGANTPAATVIQSGAKLTATAPQALGSGAVSLGDNATLAVGGLQGVSVAGFNSGTGWNLQGNQIGNPPAQQNPTATATALTIITDVNGVNGNFQGAAARSAWRAAEIPVGVSFTASFRYSQQTFISASGSDPASGMTFAIQGASATALGGTGNGLGYSGVGNSAAFAINIDGAAGNRGIAVLTNGGTTNTYLNTNAGANPIDFQFANTGISGSGLVTVNLTYNADTNTLGGTLQQGTFTQALPNVVINLASVVGSLGRFGFTAATTADRSALMVVDNFTYNSTGAAVYTAPVSVAAGGTSAVNVITTTAPTIFMGTLAMGAGSTLRSGAEAGGPANATYTLNFGATTLDGANTFTPQNNGSGTGILTLGATGGTGSLAKTGAGTLILQAANTYSGTTTAAQGRLLVNGTLSAGGGAVAVQSGGFLGGTGTISRDVVVQTGGVINGGNGNTAASQTLTLAAPLTFNNNGTLRAVTSGIGTGTTNVNTTTDGASRIVATVLGTEAITSLLNILLVSDTSNPLLLNGTVTYTRRVATYTSLSNLTEGTYTVATPGQFVVTGQQFDPGAWTVLVGSGNIDVTFTPVPEPATVLGVAAVGAGLVGLVRRVRRRQVESATAA